MATNRISVIIDVAVDKANGALGSFKKSIQDADGAAGKFKAGAGAALDSVKANAANLALAGGAALVAFGAKGVAEFNKLAIESGKMSDALGIPVEDMSRLIEVAGDLGIETSSLESTIGRMNRTASSTPGYFADINAQIVKNADGTTNVNETFLATVQALNRIPDATKRAEAAQRIFGRSWQDIAELVGQGADDIRKSLAEVSDQKIIDQSEVENAREYRAAMDALNDAIQDISLATGQVLTPILTQAAQVISDLTSGVQDANEASGGYLGKIVDLAEANWKYLNPVGQVITAHQALTGATDEASESTEELGVSWREATGIAELVAEGTDALIAAREEDAKATLDQQRAQEMTNRSIQEAQRAVNDLMSAQLAAIDSNLGYRNAQAAAREAVVAYDEAAKSGKTSTEELDAAARDAEGAVLAQAAAAVKFAEDQASANGESLTAIEKNNLFKKELEALAAYTSGDLKAALEDYIATLGRIPKSVSTSVSFGGRAPTISVSGYRASGGPVSAGGAYVVGEDGPELLQMGSQSGNVIANGATVGTSPAGMTAAEMRKAIADGFLDGAKRVEQMRRAS